MAKRILMAMPLLGGGAEVCVELAAGLCRRGLEVEVLAPTSTRAHHLDGGVKFHYYHVPQYEPASIDCAYLTFQMIWGWSCHQELVRLERDFDWIWAHLPWGMVKVYAYRRRRPLVGFIEVCWTDSWDRFNSAEPDVAWPMYVNWELGRFLQEHSMRGCDRLVAPSAFLRDHHAAKGLPIDVIRYGRDPARYLHGSDKAALRQRLGLPPGKKLVLGTGYDFSRKGHHLTAEIATRVKDDDVHFLVLGAEPKQFGWWYEHDPTLRGRLEARSDVPHQESPLFYAAADVFVFPTIFEGCPLSPLEAMASGVPVLGHRAASVPEEIDDGVEGFLVPPNDLDAYEARLRELLSCDEKRRRMGEAGRARFLGEFTLERMVDEWERYLRALPEKAEPFGRNA